METKAVVMRQDWPLQPIGTAVAGGTEASGISVSGVFIGDGVDVNLNTLIDNYGNKFTFDSSQPHSIVVNANCRVTGVFTIGWTPEGAAYPITNARISIILDGETELAGESFTADTAPTEFVYYSSGGFGPISLTAGARLGAVVQGVSYDPTIVLVGVMWETDEGGGSPQEPEEEPPPGALDITSIPTIPTLTEDQAL